MQPLRISILNIAVTLLIAACVNESPDAMTPEPSAKPTSAIATLVLAEPTEGEPSVEILGPAPRTHGPMFYEPKSGRIVLTGGNSCANTWDFNDMDLQDIWAFDQQTEAWEYLGELNVLNPFNFGYDAESGVAIYLTYDPIETWAFDPNSGVVQNMMPEEQPPAKLLSFYMWGAPLAYDSESDRLILFGGSEDPSAVFNDTWAYDYNANTWTNMEPPINPPGRAFHQLVYDAESDRIIMWGGFQAGGEDNRVWAYDFNANSWEALENSSGPQQHWERYGMVYHPPSDRMILYSGFQEESFGRNETVFEPATWTYDYNTNTWEEIPTENNPDTRFMYSMAYDSSADKVILFSGERTSKYANDLTTEVWLFDPVQFEWTDVSKEYVGCQ